MEARQLSLRIAMINNSSYKQGTFQVFYQFSYNNDIKFSSQSVEIIYAAVELFWPHSYKNVPTITHLPSRQAIKSWLAMVGFSQVNIWEDVYSKDLRWQRTVITAIRDDKQ